MSFLQPGFALLAWPTALGALAAALLAQGGRFSAKLDVFSHFAPIYVAMALLAAGLALLGPRSGRLPLLAVVALAVALGAALIVPELLSRGRDPRAPAEAPDRLRIVQFNAWGENAKTDQAAAWIAAQEPDIVVLEEPGGLPQKLARYGYAGDCGQCSALILSKRPTLRRYAEPRSGLTPGLIAWAVFDDPGGEITVVATHRYWPVRFNHARDQTAKLDTLIASLPRERLIVSGDFNSTPWSFARRREDRSWGLIRRTRALFTWPAARRSHNRLPAPFPWLPIDQVYAGPGWATVSVERGPELGSDHYPVVVTLAPRASGAR